MINVKHCARCGELTILKSYCQPCRNAYMREWRKTHPLTGEQRIKDNARSYLGTYIRRGLVKRQPCEACGTTPTHGHHDDYSRPLDVRWLCAHHHRLAHMVIS